MATQPSEWTYRLTGFPPDVTVTEAESILRSKYGDSCCPSVLSLGLDPYVPGRNVMKVATVSFTEVPEDFLDKKRNQWSVDIVRENSARTKINLIVDTHFLGFTPLNEVKDDAQHKIE
ncbi:hypothetical protein EIK77_004632 [Talaromyces pinophilus]|nr:hypothetical protein EIK77_004632 [Talaromyces pinophilus]